MQTLFRIIQEGLPTLYSGYTIKIGLNFLDISSGKDHQNSRVAKATPKICDFNNLFRAFDCMRKKHGQTVHKTATDTLTKS